MPKYLKYLLLIATASCLLLPQVLMATEGIRGNLVDVSWLEKNLGTPDVLILDASSAQAYAAKHIPGAVSADLITYGTREMPVADMEKLYRSWGINSEKKVVLYDQGGSILATRLFFSLYYYGFPVSNLFLLDGGLFKWEAEGLPLTQDITLPEKGSFTIKEVREEARVELPEFLTATGDPVRNAVLEALGPNWHFGEVLVFDRAGHIPHGILLPSADFYNPDKTFKPAEEIARMLAYLGVAREQRIYTYCGGGVAASVPWFALKFMLNYPRVKLYTGSEMDWLADERRLPYWTYDAPFLMRETSWLQFWGGQLVRTYRGAGVTIVDVRPADAFQQGHVPFAVNIPAEIFKGNIADPEKLAGILSAAGIDAAHEAVVISGAGLTRDSALAFVMLEKLGQRKVSVFTDSLQNWAQVGLPVSTEATAASPPRELFLSGNSYAGHIRKDVIIADPSSTLAWYPKVFLASGQNVPDKVREAQVVHVPYTELLGPGGKPKAAKDIWNILAKAGVPRYAELVCFADDPGEAAVNYFILKLMGYPDVKMLVN